MIEPKPYDENKDKKGKYILSFYSDSIDAVLENSNIISEEEERPEGRVTKVF